MNKTAPAFGPTARAQNPEIWNRLFELLARETSDLGPPTVKKESQARRDPFRILIATMISLRTKDETTAEAARRLFEIADTPEAIAKLRVKEIAQAIRPANFYATKAVRIKKAAERIAHDFAGRVPDDLETLLTFEGVGRKTANLVLSEGYGLPAICVDTHVHRILNRIGLVRTRHPEETERALREVMPEKYWRLVNSYLVTFGQNICRPVSPYCSRCGLVEICERIGVKRNR